jgi:hypothetical protein
MSIKAWAAAMRDRWAQARYPIGDYLLAPVVLALGWPRNEVPVRWKELKKELILDCGLYLVMIVYAFAFMPSGRLRSYLLPAALCLAFCRRFAISRWDTTGARAWARWVVAYHLRELIDSLDHANVQRRLSLSDGDVALLKTLRRDEVLATQELFRHAGSRPARPLAPLTLTILSSIAFVIGVFVGALLQGDAVVDEVRPLCQAHFNSPSVTFAAFVFLVGVAILLVPKIAVKKREVRLFAKQGALIAANPRVWLRNVNNDYLDVLRTDVQLALTLARTTGRETDAVLHLHNIPVGGSGHRLPFLERVKLSQVNEIAMVEAQLVLGIYLGLALPFLLKVQC